MKPVRAGLVLGWVTTFKQKPFVPIFSCYFLYSKLNLFLATSIFLANIKTSGEATFFKCYSYLRLAVAVQSGVSLTFLASNLLWRSSLIETSRNVSYLKEN